MAIQQNGIFVSKKAQMEMITNRQKATDNDTAKNRKVHHHTIWNYQFPSIKITPPKASGYQ